MPASPPLFGYSVTNAFGAVSFNDPVAIASPPDETNRLFVVERVGTVAVITNLAAPTRTVFLNLSNKVTTLNASEGGLLGLAFHPGFATNGYFYVFYYGPDKTSAGPGDHEILARYEVSPPTANFASAATETKLLRQYDQADNHNAGDLHFGPDGYLYVSLGDEGGANGDYDNDQRIDKDYFAGILRLDVDKRPGSLAPNPHPSTTANYAVPPDNPFVGATSFNGASVNPATVRTEFWAVGLRNPWRFSFDPLTGLLYLGDVGQDAKEEVNIITKGGNYGWAYREANIAGPKSGQAPSGFTSVPPILTYDHGYATNQGFAIIGGVVSRGNSLSQLAGDYVFGDNLSGNVWALVYDGTNVTRWQRIASAVGASAFGVDPRNGDVLLAVRDVEGGNNWAQPLKRLVYSTNSAGQSLPPTLADTGAFAALTNLTPNAGIVAYDINVPFWSDNAIKRRWYSVPNTNLTIGFDSIGNWSFPTGTVWIKHFDLQLTNGSAAQRIETRLLVKNAAGTYGVSYRWGGSLTNATLVSEGGMDESFVIDDGSGLVRTQVWRYPARQECQGCHTVPGGHALGFNTAQLNRDFDYGGAVTNQIQALSDAGYFNTNVSGVQNLPALASPTNTAFSTETRVRSYLSANCVQCHQPGGSALALWDARFSTPTPQAGIINGALINNLSETNNRVIAPGSLSNSVLLARVANFGPRHMPPLATSLINTQAVQLLSTWITNDLPGYIGIQLSPTTIAFNAVHGTNPASHAFGITNVGDGLLSWTAASEGSAPAWLTVAPANGTGDGLVSVSPVTANLPHGTYSKTIAVTGVGAVNSPQMVTVVLTVNQPPVANNDAYNAAAGATLNVGAPGVLGNDTDAEGSMITAVLVSAPAHGMVSLNANGSFSYSAAGGYIGPDSYTYKANDGTGDSGAATVSLTITDTNGVLVFDDFVRGTEPGPLSPWVTNSGTWTVTTGTLRGASSSSSYGYAYLTNEWTDYSVQARVQFPAGAHGGGIGGRLTPKGNSNLAGKHYGAWLYPEGSSGGSSVLKLLEFSNWTTINSTLQQVGLSSVGTNWHSLRMTFQGNRIQVYYDGTQMVDVTDRTLTSGGISADLWTDTTPYTMNVKDVVVSVLTNHPPLINIDSYSVNAGAMLTVSAPGVLSNDTDADLNALTAVLVSGVGHGTLSLNPSGSFTYIPPVGYSGSDSFVYQANDGSTISSSANVNITVVPLNQPPVANNDNYNVSGSGSLIVGAPGVLVNDADAESNALTAVPVAAPGHGLWSLNADGSFGYAPVPGYSGPDSFTYKASDGNSNSSVATVNLTVGKSPATVTLEDLNQVYDKTARQATAATGPPGLTVNLSYSGSSNAPTNVGSYQVIGVVSEYNYAGAATNTLIVQPRPLGVAANDEIRAYGQTNPLFNGVITGLRAGDDITATYSTVADADSPPGVYAIVPTLIDPDGRLMNYATTLTNGSLAVVDLVPNLVDILELPDATFALEWRVCAGRTYRLQHKDRLADAEWATATDDFTPVSWSVTLTNDAGTNLHGFYRLLDVTGP